MPYGDPTRRGVNYSRPKIRIGQKVYDVNRFGVELEPGIKLQPNGYILNIIWGRGGPKTILVKFHDEKPNMKTYVEYERHELGWYQNETMGWQVPERD